ncbi:AMP-binding protein [Nocardioides sp. BP30]|uniref:AMP-binding protein n=1 Tax=Nocardioides sp. BP30 TaxID=3036374 RepID=UPI002468CF93|nr:AMP-binding protein [Nocardioides sp. BP30]WGL54080.1 AMP-binding protein [Nocardioides sp. BP30]
MSTSVSSPGSDLRLDEAGLTSTTVWRLVADRADLTPQAEFAVDEHGRHVTFAAFRDLALGIAAGLAERGVRAGDVVSWQLPTSVESMALAVALARLGAVQNPIIPMLRAGEVEFITRQVGARLLIVPRSYRGFDHAAMAEDVRRRVDGLDLLVIDEAWPVGDPDRLPEPSEPGSETATWIFYTSGTTAAPKGVRHRDSGLIAASRTFVLNLEATPEDRCAAFVPVAHVGGITHLLHALLIGHALIVSSVFAPEANADLLIEQGATLIGSGLPYTNEYLRISKERGVAPLFPRSRAVLGGGSGRPQTLSRAAAERLGGVGIISGYGMTECPYITWGTPHDTDEQHASCEGIPAGGGEVRIVGDDGTVLGIGEIGEIRVRGPQLFLGYVDASLDADAFDADGFFHSGDLGFLDPDGRLAVTGRIKDVIVRKMENISAQEVESALIGAPGIADVAVIGLPDPVTGERVCAVVVPADPQSPPDLASVQAYLRSTSLNIRKFPEQVEVVASLARNSLGKLIKSDLRSRFAPDAGHDPQNTGDDMTETLYSTIEFRVVDHIATITLDRPDRLNSFNQTMTEEMADAWARVRDDDDIRVAVLRANGDRAFCTGMDVGEGAWWSHLNAWNQEDPGVLLGPRHHRVWKPVICAVHGMAAGGAMYFINQSDIVICSEDATFFDPHANGGIVSALEPMGMLARGIPLGEVLRWALLGSDERITAETALRIGLVTEVVPAAELRDRARQLADEIAGRRPEAIQGTVRAIWESLEMTPTTALRNGLSYTQIGNAGTGRTDSRTNKRAPRFR